MNNDVNGNGNEQEAKTECQDKFDLLFVEVKKRVHVQAFMMTVVTICFIFLFVLLGTVYYSAELRLHNEMMDYNQNKQYQKILSNQARERTMLRKILKKVDGGSE